MFCQAWMCSPRDTQETDWAARAIYKEQAVAMNNTRSAKHREGRSGEEVRAYFWTGQARKHQTEACSVKGIHR